MEDFPTIAPKSLKQFGEQEFRNYVKSLYQEPIKVEPKPYSVSINKKGNPVITVRRKPKWVSLEECEAIALKCKVLKEEVVSWMKKRKIEVKK